MITNASATNSWIKSENLPFVSHTANNPGNIKICGDHKCGPFEDIKKSLQDKLKRN
jgi:phosphoribosyl-dephospho-CoA transferase